MSNIRKLPPELGALLAAIGLAKQITIEIDPNSTLSEDQQIEAAIEKAAAAHRAECEGCREAYEAEQVAAATESKERRQGQVDRRAQGKPTSGSDAAYATERPYEAKLSSRTGISIERPDVGSTDKAGAVSNSNTQTRDRIIVGHMAYIGNTPIMGTFGDTAEDVRVNITIFTNDVDNTVFNVRPVFAD